MSQADLALLQTELTDRLSGLERRVRWIAVIRGIGVLAVAVAATIATGLVVDLLWDLPVTVRTGLLAAVGLVALFTAWRMLLRPVLRHADTSEFAALVESAHPELQERLSSTVELSNPFVPEREKGSALMRELLMQQTRQAVSRVDVGDAAKADGAGRWGVAGLFAVAALLVPFLFFEGYGLLLTRFFAPWQNLDRASNLYFEVEQGDRTVARGSDVELAAVPRWRFKQEDRPLDVWLEWRTAVDESDRRRMTWDEQRGSYIAVMPHVFQPFDFHVAAENARSRTYHVNVVEAPALAALAVTVEPPAYTGHPVQRIDGAVGEIVALAGSRLTFDMQFNKPVAAAEFLWTPEAGDADAKEAPATVQHPVELAGDRAGARYMLTAVEGGRFSFRLTDEHSLHNANEPFRRLRVTADAAPQIAYADQRDEMQARPDDLIRVPVTASDDFGLAALELHYEIIAGGEGTGLLECDPALLGGTELDHVFPFDLKPLGVADGGLVAIRARAADERPDPGPNESWTERRLITIADEADPYNAREIAERQQQLLEEIRAIRQEVVADCEQVEDLRANAEQMQQQNQPFARNEELSPLAQSERELTERLDQLAALFELHPLYANIAEETREIGEQNLTEAAQHLEQAEPAAVADKPAELQQAGEKLQAAADRLQELEGDFEQLAQLEQDLLELQRLADRTERLANDVAALDEQRDAANEANANNAQVPQPQQQQIAAEQERLQNEHQDLTSDLNELLNHRPELLDAAFQNQLDRLAELARQAGQIADREDRLAEALEQEAMEHGESLQPLANRQQELTEQAEQLASRPEMAAAQPADPLDVEELRQALEQLQAGNSEEAARLQENAARAMERLAEELRKNAELPSDPQAAARELAERQQALRQEMEQALNRDPQESEPGAEPNQEEEPASPQELAAAEAAIQAATAQLPTPPSLRNQQQQAVDQADETLRKLNEDQPQEALAAAERTQQALEQLAQQFPSEEERLQQAVQEVERLQQQQREVAQQAAETEAGAAERPAEETAQRLEQLAQRQQQIAQDAARLDAPGHEMQRNEAAQAAAEAQRQLSSENLPQAGEAQRESQQALADLERALRNEPTAGEQVAQMQAEQEQIQGAAHQAARFQNQQDLAAQAEAQRQLAEQVAQLDVPAHQEQQSAAQEAAQAAAEALNQSAQDPTQSEQAMAALEQSQQALGQLAESVTPENAQPQVAQNAGQPPEGSEPNGEAPADAAPPMGEQPAAMAEHPSAPQNRELAQAAAELAQQQRELAQQSAGQPPANNAEAAQAEPPMGEQPGDAEAAQAATEALQRQSELAQQAAALALETAQQSGAESAATEQAREFAEQAAQAAEQAMSGQLAQAAETANQAAESAQESSAELASPSDGNSPAQPQLAQRAEELAQQQSENAQQLAQAAQSPPARQAAQQRSQQQLAQATAQMERELQDIAEQLSSAPLSREEQAQQASQSQQASQQAQTSMQSAASQQQQRNFQQASQSARQAAEALRQTAQQATSAQPSPEGQPSPVPGEVGQQVTDAARQLQQAGEQLAQNQPGQLPSPEGQPGENGELAQGEGDEASRGAAEEGEMQSDASQQQPGEMQPGENGSPMNPSAAQSLQEAAAALQQAARQLQPSPQQRMSQLSQNASQQGRAGQPPPNSEAANNPGSDSSPGVNLTDLELHLQELSTRNWGELSGTLKTELQNTSRKRPEGDYARLIKLYFEDISRRQAPEVPAAPTKE